jgi:hypothetical protein
VTDTSSESPTFVSAAQAVIDSTDGFLANAVSAEDVLVAVSNYYSASDFFAAQISADAAGEDDADIFVPTDTRSRLFWGAVNDLLMFRCIGLVDCWAALNEVGVTPDDDPDRLGPALRDDFELARASFVRDVVPRVTGGAGDDDLEYLAWRTMNKIADESTEHVLGATLGAVGALIPSGTPTKAMRLLRHVGRVPRLDKLLDWAQRILDLALIKQRRVFGTQFDAIIEPVKSLLEQIVGVREHVADRLFQLENLWTECKSAIEAIDGPDGTLTKNAKSWNELTALSTVFDNWSLGLDIADTSLKWGWRISVVSPPVAIALTAARGVLAAGAFLIGRYHLDSPELDFLHWDTHGVLAVLKDNMPAPRQGGPVPKGDNDF